MRKFVIFFILLFIGLHTCDGGGFLLLPLQRSSMWRFLASSYPKDTFQAQYDDGNLNCGGTKTNGDLSDGTKCGVCGDAVTDDPKQNSDIGGLYVTGEAGYLFEEGKDVDVVVQLNTGSRGFFKFQLCCLPNNSTSVYEECFENLDIVSNTSTVHDGTRYELPDQSSSTSGVNITVKVSLPSNKTGDHCVMRWIWVKVNCPLKNCTDNDDIDETIANCADIEIAPKSQYASEKNTFKFPIYDDPYASIHGETHGNHGTTSSTSSTSSTTTLSSGGLGSVTTTSSTTTPSSTTTTSSTVSSAVTNAPFTTSSSTTSSTSQSTTKSTTTLKLGGLGGSTTTSSTTTKNTIPVITDLTTKSTTKSTTKTTTLKSGGLGGSTTTSSTTTKNTIPVITDLTTKSTTSTTTTLPVIINPTAKSTQSTKTTTTDKLDPAGLGDDLTTGHENWSGMHMTTKSSENWETTTSHNWHTTKSHNWHTTKSHNWHTTKSHNWRGSKGMDLTRLVLFLTLLGFGRNYIQPTTLMWMPYYWQKPNQYTGYGQQSQIFTGSYSSYGQGRTANAFRNSRFNRLTGYGKTNKGYSSTNSGYRQNYHGYGARNGYGYRNTNAVFNRATMVQQSYNRGYPIPNNQGYAVSANIPQVPNQSLSAHGTYPRREFGFEPGAIRTKATPLHKVEKINPNKTSTTCEKWICHTKTEYENTFMDWICMECPEWTDRQCPTDICICRCNSDKSPNYRKK